MWRLVALSLAVLTAQIADPAAAQPPKDLTALRVIANVRQSFERLQTYRVYGELTTTRSKPREAQKIPLRPAPLPEMEKEHITQTFFEDRFNQAIGRSLQVLDYSDANAQTKSAILDKYDADRQIDRISNGVKMDFLWCLQPRYASFDLLELLQAHPDVRLLTSSELYVIEIPIEALSSINDLGVRILVDPNRDYALTGVDLYVSEDGTERVFLRTDIGLVHVSGERWLPNKAEQWQKSMLAMDSMPTVVEKSKMVIDWGRSEIQEPLDENEVVLEALNEKELSRESIRGDLEKVKYNYDRMRVSRLQSSMEEGSSHFMYVIVFIAANVLLLLIGWYALRLYKRI